MKEQKPEGFYNIDELNEIVKNHLNFIVKKYESGEKLTTLEYLGLMTYNDLIKRVTRDDKGTKEN